LATGTTIRNIALVTFDYGETIATDQVDPHDPAKGTDPAKMALNTIDAGAPTSTVNALPPASIGAGGGISRSGADARGGSGIAAYDVFVSDDGGPFQPFLRGTTATSATFGGQAGHTYAFYSVATDGVGNRQPTPSAPQATTTLLSSPSQRLQFAANLVA